MRQMHRRGEQWPRLVVCLAPSVLWRRRVVLTENLPAVVEKCSQDGCGREAFRRGVCVEHYRLSLPRCQVEGCTRPAVSRKMCWPHRKLWGGPVQTRPKRTSTEGSRILAWGRLYIAADAVRRVEEEARRRGGSPSGLLAEIVERWARENAEDDAERELEDPHQSTAPAASSGARR